MAISIETTGPDLSKGNRIIEIGCVEIFDEKRFGKYYHQYINPDMRFDESYIESHGITDEFLIDKPVFSDVVEDFLSFVGKDEIVTYNAGHIISFLQNEIVLLKNDNYYLNNEVVDVLKIGEDRHPNQNNSLMNLCERYYVKTYKKGLAGALYRAEIIANLFLALIDESTKRITSNLSRYKKGENLVVVESFSDFDRAIDGISKSALCRGVSNHEYPLLPSLFRHHNIKDVDLREGNLLWVFKTHAKAHLDNIPSTEVEWLTIAQHHGLPTRLLDWSLSPLAACFFAVQSMSESDSAIYVYDIGRFSKEEEINVERLKDIVAFFPSHATRRITAQSGMFTIHPTHQMKLENKSIKKIVIPANRKKYFLEKLVKYGVHKATMFPDLDGLSSYIRYLNEY